MLQRTRPNRRQKQLVCSGHPILVNSFFDQALRKCHAMTTLTLVNLTREYTPGISAISGLDLTIEEGQLMVLLGPSGCGKTTTLRLIAGLIRPTQGDVLFDGSSVLDVPPERRSIGMVFQEASLFPFLTVGQNIAFGLKMRKLPPQEIAKQVGAALAAVQLEGYENRQPDQLSGGQRKRVALARALVIRPKLLLLDEPLTNLDQSLRGDLREMIRSLQREAGITTLFVTHDQTEAVAIADRIALLMDGRLRQTGRPQDFYERPADASVARFFGSDNFIPGIKQGQVVRTALGPLSVSASAVADGPVLLTIRAEAIKIGTNGNNTFKAQVHSSHFQGSTAYLKIGIAETILRLATPPFSSFADGDEIDLHLPPERIGVLPPMEEVK
jgi:ABC-type Fe3+/spermidine/putrescine transport system ATPase subunit